MRAGKLRQVVRIERATLANDAAGQPVEVGPPKAIAGGAAVPAEVLAVSGGETVRGSQMEAGVTTLVTMQWRGDVTTADRIIHDGRALNVVRAVDPDGRRRSLVCQCSEVAA